MFLPRVFGVLEMNVKLFAITALAAATLIGGPGAQAATIALFNTGVDATGTPQPNLAAEIHYALVSGPDGAVDLRAATQVNGFPLAPGPWLDDDNLSAWIGPVGDRQLNGSAGTYDYRVSFTLAGLDPSTAVIRGRWSADNRGDDILINGVSTGQAIGSDFNAFRQWFTFEVNSGFRPGVNTLDFLVFNREDSTGLRVEMTGSAVASTGGVPEPSTWALLIGGLGLTGLALRRRRGQVAFAA